MKFKNLLLIASTFTLSLFVASCGGNGESNRENTPAAQEEEGLSAFELEHGIGPVTEHLDIDDTIDGELVTKGRNIFEMKCEMCHNMEGRMVGPELGDVTDRRSPEYIMNMILNPGGMARNHPEGQKLVQEYMSIMPFQNVSEDDARAIVEYLRDYSMNN